MARIAAPRCRISGSTLTRPLSSGVQMLPQSKQSPFPCWEAGTSLLAATYETLLAFLDTASARQRQAYRQ